jgi:CMP-N,N'-diacetyllegionaminic acid synthase
MDNVIAIIPARAGSKSLIDKNIKLLSGHPLLAYSILAAKLSKKIARVIVSTNSSEYAEIAIKYGAEVPFMRPHEYSTDTSSDKGFLIHAMEWIKENEKFIPEYWVHLRPTTPIRVPSIIDEAIDVISNDKVSTSLRSAHKAPESPLKWFIKYDKYFQGLIDNERYNLPKEKFEQTYIPDGYVDIVKASWMLNNNSIHGDKIIAFESPVCTEVDSIEEFDYIEYQMKNIEPSILNHLNHIKR